MNTRQLGPPVAILSAALLSVLAGISRADAPAVEILAPVGYASPVPRIEVRFTFAGEQLLYETVAIVVDGVVVAFDPENDGRDNDGDELVDEPGESVWSELSDASATMVAWLPYSLRTDDPATPRNEGQHTISAGAYNSLREWGEAESSFEVVEQLSTLDAYCFPNPFTPEESNTQVAFTLTTSAKVTIEVHDFAGNRIDRICKDEWRSAGMHLDPCDRWWGRDSDTGGRVPAGVYFITVKADRNGQWRTDVVKVGVLPKR